MKETAICIVIKVKLEKTHRDLITPHGCVPPISSRFQKTVGLRVPKLVLVSFRSLCGQQSASVETW